MSTGDRNREARFQIWGWILFLMCAILFLVSSAQSRDVLMLVGSILFLVACVVFMIPLLNKQQNNRGGKDD